MSATQPSVDRTATIGANASIGEGVTVAAGAEIGANAILVTGVNVGVGAVVGPGVYLGEGTTVGNGVVIGPNASVVGPGFERGPIGRLAAPTAINDGARVGANATVLRGVTIGRSAVIGAGSVVNRDVPPFATAVGAPARIVGYESSSQFTAGQMIRSSTLTELDLPIKVGRAEMFQLPQITDIRGSLSFAEFPSTLPFVPKRYFLIFDVPSREVRGEHAHKSLHQLLVCVHGECAVAIDDGEERGQIILDRADVAVHLPPMVWASEFHYSQDAVLLVLASEAYDADDYIRMYDEFETCVARSNSVTDA